MKLLDAPPIFSYKFDKYLVDRIVSGHKILQNKHIDVIIENNNVNIVTEILLNNGFQNLLKGDNHE